MKNYMCIFLIIFSFMFIGCDTKDNYNHNSIKKPNLLIYCGITMVKPMTELADRFKKMNDCDIVITQGGSEDLYQSLKCSQIGDLYLPGSPKYLKIHKKDGFFQDSKLVGYNQAAIFVKKGNPLNIDNNLTHLLNPNIRVVICDPETGSIGKATKSILKKAGIYEQVYEKAVYLATDSRDINQVLMKDKCDLAINWYATAFFENTKDKITAIKLTKDYSKKKELMLTLLSFSKNKDLALKFLDYATSEDGKKIFKKYGFLD